MPRKTKPSVEALYKAVTAYLTGRINTNDGARRLGLSWQGFSDLVCRYESEGIKGLQPKIVNKCYKSELKALAVGEYLQGEGSLQQICKRYAIRSRETLRRWIKAYNRHEATRSITGGSHMTQGRKTTMEERLKMVTECVANGKNYGEIALKYKVSYQQIYDWVKKYLQKGEDGLDDRRGKKLPPQGSKTEEQQLRARVRELEQKLYFAEMENACLKKLDEVERGLKHKH